MGQLPTAEGTSATAVSANGVEAFLQQRENGSDDPVGKGPPAKKLASRSRRRLSAGALRARVFAPNELVGDCPERGAC
jgi:hypothetical protein